MKIKFPIDNERDEEVFFAIIAPEVFYIKYASPAARNFYNSLTEQDKQDIRDYVNKVKENTYKPERT